MMILDEDKNCYKGGEEPCCQAGYPSDGLANYYKKKRKLQCQQNKQKKLIEINKGDRRC